MRKAYQKPLLYAESYELSQHIAACDIKLESQSTLVCCGDGHHGIFDHLENLFTKYTHFNICKIHCEAYCYTNGMSGFATHMS